MKRRPGRPGPASAPCDRVASPWIQAAQPEELRLRPALLPAAPLLLPSPRSSPPGAPGPAGQLASSRRLCHGSPSLHCQLLLPRHLLPEGWSATSSSRPPRPSYSPSPRRPHPTPPCPSLPRGLALPCPSAPLGLLPSEGEGSPRAAEQPAQLQELELRPGAHTHGEGGPSTRRSARRTCRHSGLRCASSSGQGPACPAPRRTRWSRGPGRSWPQ